MAATNGSSTIWIADSGGTKTDWVKTRNGETLAELRGSGTNALMQSAEAIAENIARDTAPAREAGEHPTVYFYGAGCRGRGTENMRDALRKVFGKDAYIYVHSDLLAAARALFGDGDGIACILGTGSNSGLYTHGEIASNVPPLGYILGDEGSGAVLGRRLLGDAMKRQLPERLCKDFLEEYALTDDKAIERVYRSPRPNTFLASLVPFLAAHRDEDCVQALLQEEFARFFRRNVASYRRPDLPAAFVGGVATHFREEVTQAARSLGFSTGLFLERPLPRLTSYHAARG